jgi:hypothetical protein
MEREFIAGRRRFGNWDQGLKMENGKCKMGQWLKKAE